MAHVVMPQMGESLAEGTVVRWLKKPGDRVVRDEALFEISTDKVDTDVPAPMAGVLESILVHEGETVAVGAMVATIREDTPARAEASVAQAFRPANAGLQPGPATGGEAPAGHFRSSHAPQLVSFRRSPAGAATPGPTSDGPRSYSPAVLAAARQGNVRLESLTAMRGSGRGGRVTKSDVARFLQATGGARVVAPPAAGISPHASAFAECDATRLVAVVRQHRDRFAERVGAPLTYTVVAAEALVQTLREFPAFNASVVDDTLVLKPHIHLGIAVALGGTEELVVPVVREADGLSIEGLARAINDVVTRARDRQLRVEDVQGGTFTLTNPGIFGGVTGTPILNQPQVGIVGLGAIAKRAVVLDEDRIAPRSMMTIALTFDHRAADGMAAFKFLDRLRRRIEAGPSGLTV